MNGNNFSFSYENSSVVNTLLDSLEPEKWC